jgi:hypothetical protein
MADPTHAIEAKDAKPSASMAVRHPPVKYSALAVTDSSRPVRRFAEIVRFQPKFVATLAWHIVVEAENEAQAGERGRVALEEHSTDESGTGSGLFLNRNKRVILTLPIARARRMTAGSCCLHALRRDGIYLLSQESSSWRRLN